MVALPIRRYIRSSRYSRVVLPVLVAVALVITIQLSFTQHSVGSTIDAVDTSVRNVVDAAEIEEEKKKAAAKERYEKFKKMYDDDKKLANDPSPLSRLSYCSNPYRKSNGANFLVSTNGPEGTIARMDFQWTPGSAKYNPNVLPYPRGAKHAYFGIARTSPRRNNLFHHELVWCDMDWSKTEGIGRTQLRCVGGKSFPLKLPEWATPAGRCVRIPFMALIQGHSDPRVFFSPVGEPLMIVGTNGKANCLNQWVIDLRALVPHLSKEMRIEHVPIRYGKLTEMPRDKYNEIEKNWFIMWDERYVGYVQHETERRSVQLWQPKSRTDLRNVAKPAPKCVTNLLQKYDDPSKFANDIHQASNSLRVTLCDFPCIPTIHNTVLIEIMHVKYKNWLELYYRRYVVVMNATAPFNIIGRTSNLMYAGTDERTMLYTVSIGWDNFRFREHDEWNETKHGGQDVWDHLRKKELQSSLSQIEAQKAGKSSASASLQPSLSTASPKTLASKASSLSSLLSVASKKNDDLEDILLKRDVASKVSKTVPSYPATTVREVTKSTAAPVNGLRTNPLVNKYYHGWLDDTIFINIGINDADCGILHVKARDLLECIELC
ncbi:hypothetical protein V1511DRAFT_521856 [Dipodascopsis uninucleata]